MTAVCCIHFSISLDAFAGYTAMLIPLLEVLTFLILWLKTVVEGN